MSKLSVEGEVTRLTAGPAEDGRPGTEAEHQRLHRHGTGSAEG